MNLNKGDIIVFEKKKTFPQERTQEYTAVVDSVEDNHVSCGIEGRIHKDNIVRIK